MHDAGAAAGFEKRHLVVPADVVFDADAAIELDQVGAAAEQDVLAVVDHFPGRGMLVGGGASTEEGTAFEKGDFVAGAGEGSRGGQAGQAAAGYGYGFQFVLRAASGVRLPASGFR